MDLKARVAYLQGLAEGYELKEGSKKERILLGVLDVLADIAADTESLKDRMGEMEDYLECLDEDLAEVEEFLFDDDFDADDDGDIFDDFDDDDDTCCCGEPSCGACESDDENDD